MRRQSARARRIENLGVGARRPAARRTLTPGPRRLAPPATDPRASRAGAAPAAVACPTAAMRTPAGGVRQTLDHSRDRMPAGEHDPVEGVYRGQRLFERAPYRHGNTHRRPQQHRRSRACAARELSGPSRPSARVTTTGFSSLGRPARRHGSLPTTVSWRLRGLPAPCTLRGDETAAPRASSSSRAADRASPLPPRSTVLRLRAAKEPRAVERHTAA